MWQATDALESHTQYSRLDDGRWRATYRGFVTVFADADSPRDSQMEMEKQFDSTLAELIRRTSRTRSRTATTSQVRTSLLATQFESAEPKAGRRPNPAATRRAARPRARKRASSARPKA